MLNYLAAAIALWFAFDLLVVLLLGGRRSQVPSGRIHGGDRRRDRRQDNDLVKTSP